MNKKQMIELLIESAKAQGMNEIQEQDYRKHLEAKSEQEILNIIVINFM